VPGTAAEDLSKLLHTKHNKTLAMAGFAVDLFVKKDLGKAMSNSVVFGGDTICSELAGRLGIMPGLANLGYKYIRGGEPDDQDFIWVRRPEDEHKPARFGAPYLVARQGIVKLEAALGEVFEWYVEIQNTGGYSRGVVIKARGSAIEQGFVSDLIVTIEKHRSSDEEDDYIAPDPKDESYWTFDVKLAPSETQPGVYEATLRGPFTAAKLGTAKMEIHVVPLAPDEGTKSAQIAAELTVKAPEEKAVATTAGAKIFPFDDYELVVPNHYWATTKEAQTLGTWNIPAGLDVGKQQPYQLALNIRVYKKSAEAAPDDVAQAPVSMSDAIACLREDHRSRSFTTTQPRMVRLADVTFEQVEWSIPHLKQYGIVMLAEAGEKQIELNASAYGKEQLSALRSIINSFTKAGLTETSSQVTRAGRNAGADPVRAGRSGGGLIGLAFRIAILALAVKFIFPLIPGIAVASGWKQAFLLAFILGCLLPWAFGIIAGVTLITPPLRPLKDKLMSVAQGGGPIERAVAGTVGVLIMTGLVFLTAWWRPHLLQIQAPVSAVYVALVVCATGWIRNLIWRPR
jgi:hypothetical protein